MTLKDQIDRAIANNDLKELTEILVDIDRLIADGENVHKLEFIRDYAYKKADASGIFSNQKISDYREIVDTAILNGTFDSLSGTLEYLLDQIAYLDSQIDRFILEGSEDIAKILEKRKEVAHEMIVRIESEMLQKGYDTSIARVKSEARAKASTLTAEEADTLRRRFGDTSIKKCGYCQRVISQESEYVVDKGIPYHFPNCYVEHQNEEEVEAEEMVCAYCGKPFEQGDDLDTIKGTSEFVHKDCKEKYE